MANAKAVVFVALLLAAVLAAPTAVEGFGCFPDCYDRCANGRVGDVPCATMCAQACIVPKRLPDGSLPSEH
ncbi:hypothetical protein Cni_G25708 [Canna indica]|uniref:Uncharacterized protein n=1 Tax=Canna indica TaxID=4628 RepID=A0AAQ3QQP2_9LILI|nr:hypothetical protein Cni_G25708 [Canna indica]